MELKLNRFDPLSPIKVFDEPGNYLFCLRENSKLPEISITPIMLEFEKLKVVYTGITGRSLQSRDSQQHFNGNAEGSTIRKSFGSLFGFKRQFYFNKGKKKKWKYNASDEMELSIWMKNNLILFFMKAQDYYTIENILINHFNPPLNLKGNKNEINKLFRRELKRLRNKKDD